MRLEFDPTPESTTGAYRGERPGLLGERLGELGGSRR
jgi:hypothetical protein